MSVEFVGGENKGSRCPMNGAQMWPQVKPNKKPQQSKVRTTHFFLANKRLVANT